jgi:RNA polymerase sigma-70 factor (ECF subfamily)
MERLATRLAGEFVAVDETLERQFEALLAETSALAFRVAYGVLRHREDAEDVAQEAFVKAHRSFAQLRDRDRFRAWLVRVTWRLAIDRQRNDRRRIAREAGFERGGSGTALHDERADDVVDGLAERERAAHLWAAVDALPEKLRIVIILAAIEEQDVAVVARLLGVPPGTVKSRLFLARQRLREQLQWTR